MEACKAESRFIKERCREDMDPRCHGGTISRLERLVHKRPRAASEIVQRDEVTAVRKLIVPAVVIRASVILVAAGRVGRGHIGVCHIRNAIKCLRRTNLLALGNVDRPYVVAQPKLTLHGVAVRRIRRSQASGDDTRENTREAKELVGEAPWPHLVHIRPKFRGLDPFVCKSCVIPTKSLIREKEEEFVLEHGATQATAEKPLFRVYSPGASARRDLDLLDRFLAGRHDGCTAQPKTVYAHAIDFEIVTGDALTVGANLWLVFGLEYTRVRGTTQLLGSGEECRVICRPAARVVSQHTRRQAKQFVGIVSHLGSALDVLCCNG